MRMKQLATTFAAAAVVFTATTARAQDQDTAGVQNDSVLTSVDPGDFMENEFIVSGFVGGSHSGSVEEAKVAFGGSFDYLRSGRFGFEFLADFAPELNLDQSLFSDSINVNNYMFNLIGAAPFGDEGEWRPYVSGGLGAVTFRNDLNDDFDLDADQTEFGGNIGFGVMGFANRVGFRGDIRYYRVNGDDATDDTPDSPILLIPGEDLDFWRSSAGIAIRW